MYIRRPLCLFGVLFAAVLTVILYLSGEEERLYGQGNGLDGRHLCFEGTVKGIEEKDNRSVIQIGNISVSDSDILFYLNNDHGIIEQIHIGTKIQGEGDFSLIDEACNKGQFDRRKYYALKGYGYEVYNGKILKVSSSYFMVRDALRRIRERTAYVYGHYLDPQECGIIRALVLADRSGMDEDIKEQYRDAGISHILALSGLHIVTLGWMLLTVLRRLRLPTPVSAAVSVAIMLLYCIMAGMPSSAVRAIIMFVLLSAALIVGRTYDIRTAAAAASVIMLIINPDSIYDSGFLLSFASVIGIGLVYPGVREIAMAVFGRSKIHRLHRSPSFIVRFGMGLIRTLLFSFSLQLAVMPFTMWFFYQLPVYGIAANLVVVPLAGILLYAGIALGVLGNVALGFTGSSCIINIILMPAVYIIRWILRVYDIFTGWVCSMPGSILITGRPGIWQMFVYYVLLVLTVSGGYLFAEKDRKKHDPRKLAILIPVIAGICLLFIRVTPSLEVSALDVGQGQCFVLHGRSVPVLIYDCGSTDERKIGKYKFIPFLKFSGINNIDTFFISHLDSDHVSGLLEILREEDCKIEVGRIVISGSREQKDSENYLKLKEAAEEVGIPVYTMKSGDSIEWRHLSVTCLSPDIGRSEGYDDLNGGSLVLDVDYSENDERSGKHFRMLFTGDIDTELEESLLRSRIKPSRTGYDYLQVAHHGSRSAASETFMDRVSPSVAVISAGKDNQYGHPHEETINLLKRCPGIHIYITGRAGETDCDFEDGRIRIFLFK